MFSNAAIDIDKRKQADPVLQYVYSAENQAAFLEYECLLQAIFTGKGGKLGDTFLQLEKNVFIQMLNEVGFLIHPKKPTPEEEKKQKEARDNKAAGKPLTPEQEALLAAQQDCFAEAEVAQAIAGVSSFDPDYLDYYNFLECIVRVINARPWSEEEEKAF